MTVNHWTYHLTDPPAVRQRSAQLEIDGHPARSLVDDGTVEVDPPDMYRWLQLKPTANVDTRPPPIAGMPDGFGVLAVEVRSRVSIPLLLVDGRPVSIGRGRTRIALPPGHHCVEVQSNYTSEPVIVTIGAQTTEEIEYFESEDGLTAEFGHRPGQYRPIPGPRYQMKSLYILGLIAALPLFIVAILVSGREALLMWSAIAAIYLPLLAYMPRRSRFRRQWEEDTANHLRRIGRPSYPYPWGQTGDHLPAAIGKATVNRPSSSVHGSGLILRLRATRIRYPKPNNAAGNAHLAMYPLAAPSVFINGQRQPATWGTWWYPLPAGKHTVRVVVDGVPPGIGLGCVPDDQVEDESYEFELGHGAQREVFANATVHTMLDARSSSVSFSRPQLSVHGALRDIASLTTTST
ncbi:hypothetical protein [Natronoglycomyces albus]|uniref:Uncharacterized protein n=1 Tax=Natronoglycomyces albus TaxID=2811108 RepID=A0A895XPA3_9ACTN|nr:hypothetical protein [Natronoglycomyces albus]QSB04120.1 hypothetical protein JQS30_09865 [Natronoglycomyces albus]